MSDKPGITLLETERLRLRRFTVADLDDLVELDGDPEVMRFLTNGRPTPLAVVRDEVLPRLLDQYDRWPGLGRWAALDRADGAFLGWFALDPPPPDAPAASPAAPPSPDGSAPLPPGGSTPPAAPPSPGGPTQAELGYPGGPTQAELGYRLRRSAWGRGLATEGSRALVHHAFTRLRLRRVWAETMAVNVRSRRVLEKAGLRHVRTFHSTWDDPIPGTEHGEVEYEIVRSGC